jgi:hypothetical protein
MNPFRQINLLALQELTAKQKTIDKNKNNKIDGEDLAHLRKEELKGSQHKIDKNKNNKVDAQDFKLLRKEEEEVETSADELDEGKWFKTSYGWAGGSKPGGGKYKHPDTIKAEREAKKKAKQEQEARTTKEEVELAEKLTVGGGAPVKGPNGVVSNTPPKKKPEGSKPSFVNSHEPRKSTQVSDAMGRLRSRMDASRKAVKEATMTAAERDAKFKADADKYDADRKAYVAKHGEAATKQNTDLPPSHPKSAESLAKKMKEELEIAEGMTKQDRERAANEAERRAAAIANNPRIAAEVERRKKAAAEARKKQQANEQVQKVDVPAYLRKAKGDTPLKMSDLKRKDTLSDKDNLAKARGVKEEVESLDELDKKTLASYAYKAANQAADKTGEYEKRMNSADAAGARAKDGKLAFAKDANKAVQQHSFTKAKEARAVASKRLSGLNKAVSKLAFKEDKDEKEKDDKDDKYEDRISRSDYKVNASGRKSHKEIVFGTKMKEETNLDEAKPGLYANINAKRKRIEAGSGERMRKPGSKGAPSASDFKDAAKTANEEVELQEANHREFASQGKMHPDMAKHMSVGDEHDYYEPKTGDKVSGKVMHKSATEVHMKQTHDSYDPKKKGSVHKFAISSKLEEGYYEKPASAYRRKGDEIGGGSSKNDVPFDGPYTKTKPVKNSDGTAQSPMSRARELAKKAIAASRLDQKAKKKTNEELSEMTDDQIAKLRSDAADHMKKSLDKQSDDRIAGKTKKPESFMAMVGRKQVQAVKGAIKGFKEETDLEEKIDMKKASMGDVIKDFKASDAPQFKGKSDKKRREMAVAAKLSAQRNEELHMNSFKSYLQEDLDEAMWPGTPEYKKKFGDTATRGKVGSSSKTSMGTQTVTGTGVKHERDYEKAEKQTSAPAGGEKRGRGRPAGAASGARQKGSAVKSDDRYDSTGYKLHLPARK